MRLLAPAIAALLAAAPVAFGGSPRPTLRPVSMQPLVIKGAHFKPGERVRVTVRPPGAGRRLVVRKDGTLTVSFPGVAVDRCTGVSLSAVGSFGDRAEWAMKLPKPACLPAP